MNGAPRRVHVVGPRSRIGVTFNKPRGLHLTPAAAEAEAFVLLAGGLEHAFGFVGSGCWRLGHTELKRAYSLVKSYLVP